MNEPQNSIRRCVRSTGLIRSSFAVTPDGVTNVGVNTSCDGSQHETKRADDDNPENRRFWCGRLKDGNADDTTEHANGAEENRACQCCSRPFSTLRKMPTQYEPTANDRDRR